MRADLVNQSGVIWSWITVMRRRWRSGLAVFAVMLTLSALMVLTARPVYRADAKLRIGEPPPSPGVSATGTSILGFMRLGGDPFANDLELLGSRTVTEAIVRDHALTANVIAPRGWHRDSLFSVFTTSDSTIKALYEATWLADSRIRIEQKAPRKRDLGVVSAGERIVLGGVTVAFRARKPRGPERVEIKTMQFGEAAQLTKTRVKVARKRRDANVAEIIYVSTDPTIARNVVATAANRFIELRSRIAGRESEQNVDSLRTVARQTLAELQRAEDDLARMQRDAQLVDPTTQNKVFVEQYAAVNQELETARAELQAMDSVLQRAASATTPSERWTRLLAHPSFLENPTIAQLLGQLNGLEAKRAELAPRRTETNLEFKLVLEQIDYISSSLAEVAAAVQKTLAEKVTMLEQQVQRMDAALAALPRNTIELARRQRSARVLSEVLVLTEQRLRQEELRQALSFANVQIIDPAALRFKPVWPRKKLGLAVGGLLAMLFGVLAMAVSEHADRRVRHAGDVMRLTGAPLLGVAVRTRQQLHFHARELNAVVHHASRNGRGPLRVVLAPVGRAHADDIAATLRAALPPGVPLGSADGAEIMLAGNVVDFASAAAATEPEVPLALVVESGRTTRDELARAVALIQQAGGTIGGTVVLSNTRNAADVWA